MDEDFPMYVFLGVTSSHFFVKNILYIDCKGKVFLLYAFFGASLKFLFLKMVLNIACILKVFLGNVFSDVISNFHFVQTFFYTDCIDKVFLPYVFFGASSDFIFSDVISDFYFLNNSCYLWRIRTYENVCPQDQNERPKIRPGVESRTGVPDCQTWKISKWHDSAGFPERDQDGAQTQNPA